MITHVSPLGSMDMLSQLEVDMLKRTASSDLYQLFRNCSLAVLNSGSLTDNSKELLSRFENFDINVRRERGVKLELINPPEDAFVDGRIIRSLQANLFAVLRDILFVYGQIHNTVRFPNLDLESSIHITNRCSRFCATPALHVGEAPNMIVCWGGHSINENEYLYARRVGTQLGLRELNICTGCGPGAMEAPMKGAAVGHAQQRYKDSRFIGMTEPSIIAAEPPNPLVNELIIMPDIEKRLEAFVRIAHGIIIFPGGVGTAEELLYLLGILMHPDNKAQVLPLILTGPKESADYFRVLDEFIVHTLGESARRHYRIIIDDAAEVARQMKKRCHWSKRAAAKPTTPTASTGRFVFRRTCRCRSIRRTTIWPISNFIRTNRWKCWPPTCVAPSPDCRRQRERSRYSGHREIWPLQAAWRSGNDAPHGRSAAGLRCPAPHEASGRQRLHSVLRNLLLIT